MKVLVSLLKLVTHILIYVNLTHKDWVRQMEIKEIKISPLSFMIDKTNIGDCDLEKWQ